MSRDAVLGRIRTATGAAAGATIAAATGVPPAASSAVPARPVPHSTDPLVSLFVARATQVGVEVEMVPSATGALERVVEWCAGRGTTRAAVWGTPEIVAVAERLRLQGIEVVAPGGSPDVIAQTDIGITGAEWGIAGTGSLVLASGPERPRLASLLPPVHLVLLRADRILPDLAALFARAGALPSGLTLITGPSRSADIGSVPVLGAHGPVEVHVWLMPKNDDTGA